MIFDFLFNLVIKPLIFIYEIIFLTSYNIISKYIFLDFYRADCIYSILLVSIVVNIITLPLYNRANELQSIEKQKQHYMSKIVKHIKHSFHGDEQFLMINAYYREQNYKPWYAIRSSISLLLQIPFFTAAYIFFSELKMLNGVSRTVLPFIKNYATPDELLVICGRTLNILPIIMTIINIVSSLIYTKDFSLKEKTQPIILALIFLVLLYNSPSALVIYWIFNNIFSLIKILFSRFKFKNSVASLSKKCNKHYSLLLLTSLLILISFCGLYIPIRLISNSPVEFINFGSSPLNIIFYTFTIFLGASLWIYISYLFFDNRLKKLFACILISFFACFFINYFFFENQNNPLSSYLVYETGSVRFSISESKFNLLILMVSFITTFIILLYVYQIKYALYAILLTFLLVSTPKFVHIINVLKNYEFSQSNIANTNAPKTNIKPFNLSKHGKNVIYIMIDRSIGAYFPFVLGEKPEIKNEFTGFTFYDNCLSMGGCTLVGIPGAFGGPDYSPYNMNLRPNDLLYIKHNEALSIMPINFSNNNYKVFLSDIPLENYSMYNLPSVFSGIKNVKCFNLMSNNPYTVSATNISTQIYIQKRNFIMYTTMLLMPRFIRGVVYNNGLYLLSGYNTFAHDFLDAYSALKLLPERFNILDNDDNNAVIIYNSITHNHTNAFISRNTNEPLIDEENPNFDYSTVKDIYGNVFNGNMPHLSIEICAYMQISNFVKYLKENNLYNNTRIVIVADHGCDYGTDLDNRYRLVLDNNNSKLVISPTSYNPILLVKDFDNTSDFCVSHDFMTNADSPFLLSKELFDLKNVYNNTIINSDYKEKPIVITNPKSWREENYVKKFTFEKYGPVYIGGCNGSIFDVNSWDGNYNNYLGG